jgi:hypothetical protein
MHSNVDVDLQCGHESLKKQHPHDGGLDYVLEQHD